MKTNEMVKQEHAMLAGGCFWCMEDAFRDLPGVIDVVSGYMGGVKPNPTYDEVCSGTTGHREAIEVTFDPARVSYRELLDTFWRHIDPTDSGGQFADQGSQYRAAIYYVNEMQREDADASRAALVASGRFSRPVVTEILPAELFYRAEEIHQGYACRHPVSYRRYAEGSGRVPFLRRVWPNAPLSPPRTKPHDGALCRCLTPIQHHVMKENGTEPPFENTYWNHHEQGLYVDGLTGAVLFSSRHKFDAGCGWPSFTQPLEPDAIVEIPDMSHGLSRTEVRAREADVHLGHVFPDQSVPTGRRYCINSAALRFIPKDRLAEEGYGAYADVV